MPAGIDGDRLWAAPDQLLMDAGMGGEVLVARVRLVLVLVVLIIPLANILLSPRFSEDYVGLISAGVALLWAFAVWLALRSGFYRPWLGVLTSALDVTFVSAALAVFLVLDEPHVAVNSHVVYPLYFLAIGATSLRYDARICAMSGALAALQYTAILLCVEFRFDLEDPHYAPFRYGIVTWGDQIGRVVLLALAGVMSAAVVVRSRRLRQLSARDRLTGLLNRAYLDARLEGEVGRARRYQQPLALAVIDVDHFKRFNDSFGHPAGDEGLRTLAATLSTGLRASDIVARYGGEEFVVVLPEADAASAMEKIEKMRHAVAGAPVKLPRRDKTAYLTISAGVACMPEDGDDPVELLDVADKRLFEAKEAGRNRTIGPPGVAIPESPDPLSSLATPPEEAPSPPEEAPGPPDGE
ncbi:MAG TPA: GGDEF domain-containing protein [Gemmatimonadales bacterium]|nr:GGDEF domain-containing protein [Gemmatimonadales bacterium]